MSKKAIYIPNPKTNNNITKLIIGHIKNIEFNPDTETPMIYTSIKIILILNMSNNPIMNSLLGSFRSSK